MPLLRQRSSSSVTHSVPAEPRAIGILGGARGTNEDAFAWAQLADALGVTYRDAQVGDGLPASILGLDRATIDEAASASTIVLLGPDLKEELPVLYLRLREAADQRRFDPGRVLDRRHGPHAIRSPQHPVPTRAPG